MNLNLTDHIKNRLTEVINAKRYKHTIGVAETAVLLAQKYGASVEGACLAGLLHDFAKDFSEAQLKAYVHTYQIPVDPLLMEAYELLHGKVAAHIAQHEFQIHDHDILKAIENHTTGAFGMSALEKIIYLADFVEPTRNYPGVEALRQLAEQDLDQAVLQALENTMVYVIRIGKLLHPNTLYARNEILKRIEGANNRLC